MTSYSINPKFTVKDEETLRGLFPPTHELAALKELTLLDKHAKEFISRALPVHRDAGHGSQG